MENAVAAMNNPATTPAMQTWAVTVADKYMKKQEVNARKDAKQDLKQRQEIKALFGGAIFIVVIAFILECIQGHAIVAVCNLIFGIILMLLVGFITKKSPQFIQQRLIPAVVLIAVCIQAFLALLSVFGYQLEYIIPGSFTDAIIAIVFDLLGVIAGWYLYKLCRSSVQDRAHPHRTGEDVRNAHESDSMPERKHYVIPGYYEASLAFSRMMVTLFIIIVFGIRGVIATVNYIFAWPIIPGVPFLVVALVALILIAVFVTIAFSFAHWSGTGTYDEFG